MGSTRGRERARARDAREAISCRGTFSLSVGTAAGFAFLLFCFSNHRARERKLNGAVGSDS